ncbi:hypothetical protein PAMP_009828 [Pampus punctatissimus]
MDQQKSRLKRRYQEARLGKEERDDYVRKFNCELLKKRLHKECDRQLEFNKEKQRFVEEIFKQDEEESRRRLEETNLIDKMTEQEKEREEKRAAMLQAISALHKAKIQEMDLRQKEEEQSNLEWFQAQTESTWLFMEIADLMDEKEQTN